MKETEQTLLDKIKEGLAKENGSEDWHTYDKKIRYTPVYSLVWMQVCERYAEAKAKASCEATLKKASDNAKFKHVYDYSLEKPQYEKTVIEKSSITDPSNIVIL